MTQVEDVPSGHKANADNGQDRLFIAVTNSKRAAHESQARHRHDEWRFATVANGTNGNRHPCHQSREQ